MKLTLSDEREIEVHDPLEAAQIVRAELESPDHHHPLIVSIDGAWDLHIDVGLASERGTIQVYASSGDPPYWVTFDPELVGSACEDVETFMLHGRHHTELSAKYLVPSKMIWPVLRTLLLHGRRSQDVEWREA